MAYILVAEDDPGIRTYLKINLAKRGYEVTEASNGSQVLDLIDDSPPSLLLLDLYLPMVNGLKVLELLAEQKPDFPVIVFSAMADTHYDDVIKYPFVAEVLTKPVSAERFVSSIKQALANM